MSSKPVDTAIIMVVGPCIDDTDFKSLEESIAYNAAGIDISLIVEKTDGTSAVTAITLTTGGTSDWTHKDGGYYEVEITAAQNAEEGIAYLRGVCDGVLPFESVARYDIVKANIYDSLVKGTDVLQVDVTQLLGTAWLTPGVAGTPDVNAKLIGATAQTGRDIGASVLLSAGTGAGQLDFTSGIVKSNLTQILAHLLTQTGTQLADGFEHFFDVATPTGTLDSLPAAAPNAAGGLPISAAGGLAMDTLADWVNGGRLDLILDIIAADTTTDIPALITTAQTDLDTITGSDGVTLATAQALYAPNKVVPDVAGTLATYDPPTNTEMVAAFTEIKGTTWAPGTDTLEHIRNKQTDIEEDTAAILLDTGTDGVLLAATATSAQLVDDIVDEVITGATHNVVDSLGRRIREIHDGTVVEEETAQAGSTSTITLAASANANDDFYNKSQLKIISGAGAGQTRSFKDYNGTTKVATACEDWVVTPDNTSKYVITGHACTAVFELNNGIYGLINAEVKDCLTIDTIADSYATDGNQPTIAQGILAIQQMLQEKSISGTTLTVKKPDGSTVAMTFTLDSATAPTAITRAT